MIADSENDMPYLEEDFVRYLYGPGSIMVPPYGHQEGLTVKDLEDGVEGYKRLIMHALRPRFPARSLRRDTCPVD